MFNRFNHVDARAPFIGVLGFTCAALALWLYTSRRRDEENSTAPSHFVEILEEDETAEDPASPAVEMIPSGMGATVMPSTTTTSPATQVAAHAATPPLGVAATVTPSTTTSLAPQVAYDAAGATLPSMVSVAGAATGVPPLAGTAAWTPPSVVAVAHSPRSSLRKRDTPTILHPPPPLLEDVRLNFDTDKATLSQEIIMTVTRMSAHAAAETHDKCIQKLRQNMSFGVFARFTASRDIDWNLSNLEKLRAGFSLFLQYGQPQQCKSMTVELPTTDEISIEDTRAVGDFVLPAVDSLTWTSHRNQLPLFTGHHLNVPRLPLERLTLRNVEILLRDCNIILKEFAQTLQIFKVEKLVGKLDDAFANAIATNPNARVHMVKLHMLDLDSDYSPGHMLNDFEFPVLRELSLTTRRSRLSFFEDDFLTLQERWPQITTSTILGDYNESESEFIKNKLSPAGDHSHRPRISDEL
ncbi:hypothetical protein H0H87_003571 [Tephrocybe sp. NHM501043]|nr:hypothetical protein H0H87_003571 [Tephrocybe sp. NHM501043]